MRKKVLMEMPELKVTDEIRKLVEMDIPTVKKEGRRQTRGYYKFSHYIVGYLQNGILKISVFLAVHLRFGGNKPIYEIFFDRENEQFMTYDFLEQRWSNAMIENLRETFLDESVHIDSESEPEIRRYFQEEKDLVYAMDKFQKHVRENSLMRRDKKVTDVWKSIMEQIPSLPKDWERWVDKVGITQNFIFYHYSRKKEQKGYCTWCEKMVAIKNPKHNKHGKCSCCGHPIQYKAIGKMPGRIWVEDTAYLMQRIKSGFAVREFILTKQYRKEYFKKPVVSWTERRRFLYDENLEHKEYYEGYYKKRIKTWIEGALYTQYTGFYYRQYIYVERGKVYGRTIPDLGKKELSKTGFYEFFKKVDFISPVEYLNCARNNTYLERLAKSGLFKISEEVLNGWRIPEMLKTGNLAKALGIDQFRLKRLRANNGGQIYLEWLKHEKQNQTVYPDKILRWYEKHCVWPADISFILDRMSVVQVQNYLKRQMKQYEQDAKSLISTWEDYLKMAVRAKEDVYDAIIYRTKHLVYRHDEIIKWLGDKDLILKASEICDTYPNVDEVCKQVKEKYEYGGKEYQILAPNNIEEILKEGETLSHCMHLTEKYFSRIESRETYILFLRKTGKEAESYYTLEVEPDGTVRQKRTKFNRQLADIEKANAFLRRWQKQLQRKLTKEDYELADISKELRKKELEQLRKDKVRIHGDFNGRLLAELLEEDLMEVSAENILAA